MISVNIVTVPHDEQRYPTCGDWVEHGDSFDVVVSRLPDPRYEHLVAHHEYTEALLCHFAGISQADVDAFDSEYEADRLAHLTTTRCGCPLTDTSEPGDDIHAPYHDQHQTASGFERFLADKLGVIWDEYEAAINALT